MVHFSQVWSLCLVTLLVASSLSNSLARVKNENGVKTAVFLSPKFELGPGSVVNKFYYNIDFPTGHIAIKNFNAEVVDEAGNPVPLHETYLHHWVVYRYYQPKGVEVPKHNGNMGFHQSEFIVGANSGPCKTNLGQYFGLGSETRKTATHVPDPYGIEVGNPSEIPPGYEERWLMNVHGIDTRGVENRLGCTECRCDLYNVTHDEYGQPLRPGYIGGLKCCYDQTQCRMREGFESVTRGLYMRYTVTWVDWDASVVPVKIYIFDVTDTWKKLDDSTGPSTKHHCLDGRVVCSSIPTYGEGKEPGNEAGYIVGMSTCYPHPGSVKISNGETLVVVSNYSQSNQEHTGVMGLFYILVDDASPPELKPFLEAPVEKHEQMTLPVSLWGVGLFGVAIVVAVGVVAHRRRNEIESEEGYQSILM
ncbi:uncharacterized protein LOC114266108 isoform X3 [Camellia sinensis]|uniref:uncharacterized protein LOC114266108 isoform X3 n=1 Tax=Camellia sinensis TaxID=4442 RepID=UPI001036636B|nr:uncharacterized protein LOC114266108 isoform X3 [Camellia sinensis]